MGDCLVVFTGRTSERVHTSGGECVWPSDTAVTPAIPLSKESGVLEALMHQLLLVGRNTPTFKSVQPAGSAYSVSMHCYQWLLQHMQQVLN